MKITIDNTIKDDLHNIEVDNDGTVEDLKVLLEVETQIPIDEQLLMFMNAFLDDNTARLKQLGIVDGEIIVLQRNFRAPPQQPARTNGAGSDDFLSRFFGSLGGGQGQPQPQSSAGMGRANAAMGMDPALMGMDPMSEEYQIALEKRIQQDNINENANYAQNFNPELYTHTTMLYIE
jgi:DNA damage-inducible protein 1